MAYLVTTSWAFGVLTEGISCALNVCHDVYNRYGFRGFIDRHCKPTSLSNEVVHGIHMQGGTMLGTSRGNADIRCVCMVCSGAAYDVPS